MSDVNLMVDGKYELYRVVTDWDALHDGFRERVEDLEITRAEIDAAGELQPGYSGKLLCDPRMRSLGKESLPRMLKATGMALVLVIDDERFAPVKERLVKRRRPQRSIVRTKRPAWLFTRDKARQARLACLSGLTPAQLKKIGRRLGKASAAARRRRSKGGITKQGGSAPSAKP